MNPRRLAMTPNMVNFSGKVHGGALLNLLDRVAFSCVSCYQATIKEPINVGKLVTSRASANHAGRTSKEVGIRVEVEAIRSGTIRHTNSCCFNMVAADDSRPAEAPALRIEIPAETRRHRAAELRCKLRQDFAIRHEQATEATI